MPVLHGWQQLRDEVSKSLAGPSSHASFETCVQNSAERLPAAAAPSLQLHLAPDHVAGFGGIDLDSRERRRKHHMTQRLCLFQDAFSRKISPALLEYPLEKHALHIAGEIAGVLKVSARQVPGKERLVGPHALIVIPFRVSWILVDGTDDDTDGILQPGRLQGAADRARWKIDDDLGLPADLGRLANCLRG